MSILKMGNDVKYNYIYPFGSNGYCTEKRWKHYYKQLSYCVKNENNSYLIIGPGDHIVPTVLKHIRHCKVDTFDIKCGSTYKGDIKDIANIVKEKYDCILCCEVLEHIDFEYVKPVILDLIKLTNKQLIISIPLFRRGLNKHHKWEIGYDKIDIDQIFNMCNYTYDVVDNIFYILITPH